MTALTAMIIARDAKAGIDQDVVPGARDLDVIIHDQDERQAHTATRQAGLEC